MKDIYKDFVADLLTFDNCFFWSSKPPTLCSDVNPINNILSSFKVKKIYKEPSLNNSEDNRKLSVHPCPNIFDEVESAIKLVEGYLSQGVPASQISILLTDESAYSKVLNSLLSDRNIECNLAVSIKVSDTSFGIWFLTSLRFYPIQLKSLIY